MNVSISAEHREELQRAFTAFSAGVYRHMYSFTRGDRALAEDLVQETFLAAARQWPKVRVLTPAEQEQWLHSVATNKAIDVFRHHEVVRDHAVRQAQREIAQTPASDTHDQAMSLLAQKRLWTAMAELNPRQHVMCFMRYRLGMAVKDIAHQLGCSEGNVSSQISAATRRMKADVLGDPTISSGDEREEATP